MSSTAESPRFVRFGGFALVFITFCIALYAGLESAIFTVQSFEFRTPSASPASNKDVTMVLAHALLKEAANETTDWLTEEFPDWNHVVYVTDNLDAVPSVIANKGAEAMAYLTYIIDNYDNLSPITLFHHGGRYQWHADDPIWDGVRQLRRLNFDYIRQEGYINIRCAWMPGCPMIWTLIPDDRAVFNATDHRIIPYLEAFKAVFPGEELPEQVAAPCCSEFAMTKEMIHSRPKDTYYRARRWILETPHTNSGNVFEMMWHLFARKPAVNCVDATECYCKLYGICKLECSEPGQCYEQWHPPSFVGLAPGWPDYTWGGVAQNVTQLHEETDHIGQ